MNRSLEGKNAIVTGAARGIGAAIAKRLAAEGANVAVCDLKAEWCDETVAALSALGVKAKGYGVNVAVSAEVDACVKAVIADFLTGRVMSTKGGKKRLVLPSEKVIMGRFMFLIASKLQGCKITADSVEGLDRTEF